MGWELSRGESARLTRWVLSARAAGAAVGLGWVSSKNENRANGVGWAWVLGVVAR